MVFFQVFYNFSIWYYGMIIRFASLFNGKAKMFIEGRKIDLPAQQIAPNQKRIWFHCASMGEFEQARPIIEGLRNQVSREKLFIIVTFFSPSGYEYRKNYPLADLICYLPLDTPKNAKRFINTIQPDMAIFVKYEFWFNFLKTLNQHSIKTYSISAIFRRDQAFFQWYGKPYRKMLRFFDLIFTQEEESRQLLQQHGINKVEVAGDTRYDRVISLANTDFHLAEIDHFRGNERVLVAGSTWKEDLEVLLPHIEQYQHEIKYIIAPHEISEEGILSLEKRLKAKSIRLSNYSQENDARVLIVDSMGLLSKIYRYGHFAFIGGAFGDGLHNILEAACYGLPVFFGNKNFTKFREATDLVNQEGAYPISGYEDFENHFKLFLNEEHRVEVSKKVASFVQHQAGATEIILHQFKKDLQH